MRHPFAISVLLLSCLVLIMADPYTWGGYGITIGVLIPDSTPNTVWQPVAAVVLSVLLTVGAVLLWRNRRAGRVTLGVECVSFVLLNAVYVARDGFGRFADSAYENSAVGILPVLGLVVRIVALRLTRLST